MKIVIDNLKERLRRLSLDKKIIELGKEENEKTIKEQNEKIEWFIKAIDETEQAIKVLENK